MSLFFTSGQFGESQTLRKSKAFSKWLGRSELNLNLRYSNMNTLGVADKKPEQMFLCGLKIYDRIKEQVFWTGNGKENMYVKDG